MNGFMTLTQFKPYADKYIRENYGKEPEELLKIYNPDIFNNLGDKLRALYRSLQSSQDVNSLKQVMIHAKNIVPQYINLYRR